MNSRFPRRRLLLTASSFLAAPAMAPLCAAAQSPRVSNPRATDGDERFEPMWEERLEVTVGPRDADIVGTTDRAIQAACDYVARMGGGTVQLLPGKFTLRNAIHLPSRLRLRGSGADTVMTKIASATTPLVADSDWYDQEVTLQDAAAFQVGDGVVFRAKNPATGADEVIKRTLVARSGNRFKLNDGLRDNLWLSGKPTCASLFALLTSEYTSDVVIENLVLDGNRENNEHLNGNYVGGVFLQDCNRYTINDVEVRNYNGDGISFQICHDVSIQRCHSHDNAGLGLHPGSGSQRPVMRDNTLERNQLGLFWCWGVKFGLAEGNTMRDNRDYGISIGHNDTDNVMRKNTVSGNGKVGILFRDDSRGQDFWPNRNVVEENRISDSGGEDGVAIDVRGRTKDVRIANNEILETRQPMSRIGIRIAATAKRIELVDNAIQGFATEIADQRT